MTFFSELREGLKMISSGADPMAMVVSVAAEPRPTTRATLSNLQCLQVNGTWISARAVTTVRCVGIGIHTSMSPPHGWQNEVVMPFVRAPSA